jgi:hypothetical protein
VFGSPTINELWEHRQKEYVLDEVEHITGYTRRSLTALLARAGFRAVEFYPGTKPGRFRRAAVVDDNPPSIEEPLAEAIGAFRRYRETDPRWNPAVSVRENAARYNQVLCRVPSWGRRLGRRVKGTLMRR